MQITTAKGPQPIHQVIKDNLQPAFTVALVSITLSIALGIASGSTPVSGLAAAIWGGLVAGSISSSNYNIIGPAGALTGMLSTYSDKWGPEILPWISLFSGVVCMLTYVLNLHKYLLIMPKSVFEGFTVAVAFIIGLKQMNFAFGLKPHHKHGHFFPDIWESLLVLPEGNWGSTVLFFPVTIGLLVLMRKVPAIPWMVLIPTTTIFFGWMCDPDVGFVTGWNLPTLKTKYGMLTPDIVVFPDTEALAASDIFQVLIAACSVAFVAVLETLISAKIAAFRTDKDFDEKRETGGIAVCHLVCGVLGALPPTGVFVRTSINVQLGATHRIAQWINAFIVMIITLAAMPIFSYLPQASIAGMLVTAAGRMFPKHYLAMLWKCDKPGFRLCLFTAFLCCAIDPVVGLVVGMLLAFMQSAALTQKEGNIRYLKGDETDVIYFKGPLTYPTGETILEQGKLLFKQSRSSAKNVVFHLDAVSLMDTDGIEYMEKLEKALSKERTVYVKAFAGVEKFAAQKWIKKLADDGQFVVDELSLKPAQVSLQMGALQMVQIVTTTSDETLAGYGAGAPPDN